MTPNDFILLQEELGIITFLIVAEVIILTIIILGRIKMTQREAHDELLAALTELKTAINAAAQRVVEAQANPEQLVDVTDLKNSIVDATNTANAIAPSPVVPPVV